MDFNQLLAGRTGQDGTAPLPRLQTEKEPLGSGILNTVARAALAKHTGKQSTHDDQLARLW